VHGSELQADTNVRAVCRFSAVFRWKPEILLSLIYRSDKASAARTLKSGIMFSNYASLHSGDLQ